MIWRKLRARRGSCRAWEGPQPEPPPSQPSGPFPSPARMVARAEPPGPGERRSRIGSGWERRASAGPRVSIGSPSRTPSNHREEFPPPPPDSDSLPPAAEAAEDGAFWLPWQPSADPSPRQLSEASCQPSPGPLQSPRQPLPVPVNHQPSPRHPGNRRQTHRPMDTTSSSCPQASWPQAPRSRGPLPLRPISSPLGGTAPTLAGVVGAPGRVGRWGSRLPSGLRGRPVLRLCIAPCLSPRSLSCMGLSSHNRELFKMQAMSLPC